MFGDFFKDRVVDWDSVKELALILGSRVGVLGYITLTAWCMICWRIWVGIALLMTPIVGFILVYFFIIYVPKNPVIAQERREKRIKRKKEQQLRKEQEEAELKKKLHGRGLLWN